MSPAVGRPRFRENRMPQTAIFAPMFATVGLTVLVWMYMYIRRITFITRNKIKPKDLAVPGALAQLSPRNAAVLSLPVLYADRMVCCRSCSALPLRPLGAH